MSCNVCKIYVDPNTYLFCHLCRHKYHYKCLNMKTEQFKSLTKEYRSMWSCGACTKIKSKRGMSNFSSPVTTLPALGSPMDQAIENDDLEANIVDPKKQFLPPGHTVTMENISQLLDIKLESSLMGVMSKFRETFMTDLKSIVRSEMEPLISELKQDFTQTTDLICAEQRDLKAEIKEKGKIISSLKDDNLRLNDSLRKIESKMTQMESISRASNVELHAVPEFKNENLIEIFKKLCDVVNVSMDQFSIQSCRRVAVRITSSDRPRNILITLKSPRERDLVISAVHRYNKSHKDQPLASGHLGISGVSHRIYAAENLSLETRALFAETRKVAKENNFKYVWVRFGKIYLRKDDTANAILIKTMDTLSKIAKL